MAIITCLIVAFIAGYTLLHPGLPPTHDGEYHVIRFYEFDKTLRDGNLYPRWAPDLNNGYGVPLFNFVYPLPNYAASLFHAFGFSFIDAFKLNLFFATILGALFFYLWSKEYWGSTGGIISSVFYTVTPYRFVDIYIRGSVGEVWALAFFPGLLWSLKKLSSGGSYAYLLLSSFFLAATIFSHNILAVMFFIYGLSYMCLLVIHSKTKRQLIYHYICVVVLGVGLSAIFWLPALFERQFVTGLQIYNVKDNFPELFQLLIPSWGTGFSGGSLEGQMSFQIGIANLLAILLAFVCFLIFLKRDKGVAQTIFFQLLWFIVTFFLLLRVSYPLWEAVPIIDYFQFPWRFLSLMMLVTSFLAGAISLLWKNKVFSIGFAFIAVFLSIGYAKPAHYHNRNDDYYLTRSNFIDGTNSPGNYFNTIWFDKNLKKQKNKIDLADAKGSSITSDVFKPQYYTFTTVVPRDTAAVVQIAYFPGWDVFIDGSQALVTYPNGVINFSIPKGRHIVAVRFTDTIVRRVGAFISLSAFIVLLFVMYTFVNPMKTK